MTPYAGLLGRLYAARRFGMKLGIERMRELLDRLGAPDRHLGHVVHVGGTNGKGSTAAMIAALVRTSGRRVAVYSSPHLSTLRERITIDGELAGEGELVAAAERVAAAGGETLTFFEQLTAIAIEVIARACVDLTVLEVGLGGRLDATNAVDAPVAVVTGVALDHQEILGDTLDAIAFEKAGIFKPGRCAIVGASGEPAGVPLLAAHAEAAGVRELVIIDHAAVARVPALALAGPHQRCNAAAALAAVAELGWACDPAALATVRHPGRFERAWVGDRELILDGAHNPHGARALAATLRELGLEPALAIAASADKDIQGIAQALVPVVGAVIATRYAQERALTPARVADAFRAAGARVVDEAPDLATAVTRARSHAGTVLISGSLFLVGEARTLWLGAPSDPIAVSDPVTRRA
jgi:dihydrofolate synthase/folylpolyglutamate synthase